MPKDIRRQPCACITGKNKIEIPLQPLPSGAKLTDFSLTTPIPMLVGTDIAFRPKCISISDPSFHFEDAKAPRLGLQIEFSCAQDSNDDLFGEILEGRYYIKSCLDRLEAGIPLGISIGLSYDEKSNLEEYSLYGIGWDQTQPLVITYPSSFLKIPRSSIKEWSLRYNIVVVEGGVVTLLSDVTPASGRYASRTLSHGRVEIRISK